MKEYEKKFHKWYVEVNYDVYKETGAIVLVQENHTVVSDTAIAEEVVGSAPNKGFQIIRDEIQKRTYNLLGGKGRVLANLITKKDSDTNILKTTIKELSKQSETAIQTTTDTLTLLEENGLISVKADGVSRTIFVNPGIGHRGNRYRENQLIGEMGAFSKEAGKQK